jgi:hypothetical protein
MFMVTMDRNHHRLRFTQPPGGPRVARTHRDGDEETHDDTYSGRPLRHVTKDQPVQK